MYEADLHNSEGAGREGQKEGYVLSAEGPVSTNGFRIKRFIHMALPPKCVDLIASYGCSVRRSAIYSFHHHTRFTW